MVSNVMTRADYEAKFGPEFGRWRSEEVLRLWEEVKKLPVGSYRIFEPGKDEELTVLRDQLKGKLERIIKKMGGANFKIRFALNVKEKHVVLWKESRVEKR